MKSVIGSWRPFQNVSSPEMRGVALGKLFKNVLALLAVVAASYWVYRITIWPELEGKIFWRAWSAILAYLAIRKVLRFVCRGFFACTNCRRLKTARHVNPVVVCGGTGCHECAELQERLRKIIEEEHQHMVAIQAKPFPGGDPVGTVPRNRPTVSRFAAHTG